MKNFEGKKKRIFILAALSILSLYSAKDIQVSCVPASGRENYSVEVEHFGVDAQTIEREIAIPLEEKIFSLENLLSVQTICEYSKCRANVSFEKTREGSRFNLSAAMSEAEKSFPSDAQRPKIYANSSDAKWIFTAAFDSKKHSKEELEKALRGPLQSIQGVSQLLILGGESPELQIAFDEKRLSGKKLEPWFFANFLRKQNASALFGENRTYSNRIGSARELNETPGISSAAKAREGFKNKDSVTRINGAECILVCLKSSSESQNIRICKKAAKILKRACPAQNDFQIVFDNGREQEKMILRLFAAFFQSLAALGAVCALFYRSAKKTAAIMAWTCLDLLFSLGILGALKIPLDSSVIGGMTISLGLICDAALYLSDDAETSISAMAAAALTTICALLPLCALEKIAPGIKILSLSSAIAIGASSLLALLFTPLFFEKDERKPRKRLNLFTFSYRLSRKCLKLSYFVYILAPLIFVFSSKNLSKPDESTIIYAQVEHSPEKAFDAIDSELLPFIESVKKIKGVSFVQSEAKRGSAEINVSLKDGAKKNEVSKKILAASRGLSGSLYLPLSPPKGKAAQRIQIAVLGNQAELCRKFCKEAASTILGKEWFAKNKAQAVFHFKDDEKIFVARPNKYFLSKNSFSVQGLSHFLRWNIFGAVAAKRFFNGQIQDARAGQKDFAFGAEKSLSDLGQLQMQGVPVSALCSVQRETRPEKVYRQDGRRAAHFTIELESKKSDKALRELKAALKEARLPDGYYFSISREYEEMGKNYALAFAAFILALAAIYVLVAAQCENLLDALKALLTIPASLFLPLAIRALSFCPIKLGDATAMVFVSGICVNNAIYIMSEWNLKGRKDAFAAARSVSKSVMSSSLTTLAGSLPLMFLGAGSFSGDLAFFTFFGTIGSLAASLLLFPEMLDRGKKNAPSRKDRTRFSNGFMFFTPEFRRTCSWE